MFLGNKKSFYTLPLNDIKVPGQQEILLHSASDINVPGKQEILLHSASNDIYVPGQQEILLEFLNP